MQAETDIAERIRDAAGRGIKLRIRGHGTKDFYGEALAGEVLETGALSGIVAYEPTELFVTARGGTPLSEVERLLDERGQMLAFEPPRFGAPGDDATVGGMIATGLCGPRRVQAGTVRDFLLGVRVVDGRGQPLRFGGQVMKNVAGYDVSRLMAGSLGTLGVIVEATIKVMPRPQVEAGLCFAGTQEWAIGQLNAWAGRSLPISGSAWHAGRLCIRLSGAGPAVESAVASLGGERVADAQLASFWNSLREQSHAFFAGDEPPLWRVAVPTTTAPLPLEGDTLVEWGGGLRWLRSLAEPAQIRTVALDAGGHATLYRAPPAMKARAGVFQPLTAATRQIHQRIKQAFDPDRVLNPGRLYPDL